MASESSKYLQWILQEKTGAVEQDSELEAYWKKVKKELQNRERDLKELDNEIRDVESELKKSSVGSLVQRGNALLISLSARYKDSLKKKLAKCYKKRLTLDEDVKKARERKNIAEEELRLEREVEGEKEGLDDLSDDSID